MRRYAPDLGEHLKHERTSSDHAFKLVSLEKLCIELQRRLPLLRFRYEVSNPVPQHIQVYRLCDVVACAAADRLNGRFGRVLPSNENHFRFRSGFDDAVQNFQPVHPWHHEVQQHNLGAPFEDHFQSCVGISMGKDFYRLLFQRGLYEIEAAFIVIDRCNRHKMRFHYAPPVAAPSSC